MHERPRVPVVSGSKFYEHFQAILNDLKGDRHVPMAHTEHLLLKHCVYALYVTHANQCFCFQN